MKNLFCRNLFLFSMAAVSSIFCGSMAATAGNTPPTAIVVNNATDGPVYANLVLGQKPTTNPPNCTDLGQWIVSINDPKLVFKSSIAGKSVKFTPETQGVTTKGYYLLSTGESITYQPTTFDCTHSPGNKCSPAVTFNFFFTEHKYTGSPNNGCSSGGTATRFPNATNLGEASVNFGINDYENVEGATSGLCANADATDISVVNGVNADLELDIKEDVGAPQKNTWPFYQAENMFLGDNYNRVGVFGWAATNCTNYEGYPNPTVSHGVKCAAPLNAPRPANGICKTRGGVQTDPIIDPVTKTKYCAELSDTKNNYCNIQRAANTTGGKIAITVNTFFTDD